MKRVYEADDLLSNNLPDKNIPVFVDTTSWREFRDWLRKNIATVRSQINRGLIFYVFVEELYHTERGLFDRIKKEENESQEDDILTFEIDNLDDTDVDPDPVITIEAILRDQMGVLVQKLQLPKSEDSYKTYLNEVQDIYFHDVAHRDTSERHAEFLYLVRKSAKSVKIRVLTAKPVFQRLANTEIFLLSPQATTSHLLPANFDVFTDLQIHPRLRQVIESDFHNGDYPKVIFQAVNAFRDFVREIINSTDDGGILMNNALNLNYRGNGRNKSVSSLPPLLLNNIALNDLAENSFVGEQEGYYRFAQGVFKAIRNPNAHQTHTDPFIQQRFNDENTAVKVLCFLSMLCERIDDTKRHLP